jgi:hypothetical protein
VIIRGFRHLLEQYTDNDPIVLTMNTVSCPCTYLTEQHAMKAYWGSGCTAPRIL